MFKKTKIQLVILYTLVFFLILCVLSTTLFFYMQHTTYATIDDKLTEKKSYLSTNGENEFQKEMTEEEHESERKVHFLFWGESKKLIISEPNDVFLKNELTFLSKLEDSKTFSTELINQHYYRILTLNESFISNNNLDISDSVKQVQLVYNIDPEKNLLRTLFLLLCIGSLFGLTISFFAGLILAKKALIPIQKSWEKQSQFVADASHELRTPLSIIQTNLEFLFRHPSKTIEEEGLSIFKSLDEVKRMNKLISSLLTLARSDSNEQLINPEWFYFDDLLYLIAEQFEPISNVHNIKLETEIEKKLHMYGDKDRLHQLFVILLDNAFKYTTPPGTISITAKKIGMSVKIMIADTGIGISQEELPKIFDRFFRSDKARSRKEGGTGLGLSIAKWIIEAQQGQIYVSSQLNKGTTFTILLPLKSRI